jgi:hypothetical protein
MRPHTLGTDDADGWTIAFLPVLRPSMRIVHAASDNLPISSRTRWKLVSGAKHMVRYVIQKGEPSKNKDLAEIARDHLLP